MFSFVFLFLFEEFHLLLEVRRLLEGAVDLLGLVVIAADPLVVLREDVAAAVAQIGDAADLHRRELRDVVELLDGHRGCHGRSLGHRRSLSHDSRRRAPCLRSLGCSALLSGRGLRRLRPLALGLLRGRSRRRASSRVRARARASVAGRLSGGSLALLGRRPALEARDDLLVGDAVVVRHLLLLALVVRDGLHRQLLLEHSAVLLPDEALELVASSQQCRASALREVDPVVRVLLGRVRVLLLLHLLQLAARQRRDAHAALSGECHQGGEVGRSERERERNGLGRGHFGSVSECYWL